MKHPIGVFQIKNILNNKILVDCATNIESKWNRHISELRFGNHRNISLQEDWKNMGETNFEYMVLSVLKPSDEISTNYSKALDTLKSMVIEDLNLQKDLLY